MTDADVDGLHIAILMETLLLNGLLPLLLEGRVYLAQPPLYQVKSKKAKAKAKPVYPMSDEELLEYIGGDENRDQYNIQRFKGLGEMNPTELWDTTMNPESRTLLRLVIDDIDKVKQVFEDLMGDNVKPRSEFIEQNAKYAEIDL